jgi:hypothetical protein
VHTDFQSYSQDSSRPNLARPVREREFAPQLRVFGGIR